MNEQLNIFHNTTGEQGKELEESIKVASGQDIEVFRVFRSTRATISAEVAQSLYFNHYKKPILLTSVRRAISNLTRGGFLVKTDETETGQYGKRVYKWRVANG